MTGTDLAVLVKKHPVGVVCGLIALGCSVALYLGSDSVDETKSELEKIGKQSQGILSNVRNSVGLAEHTNAMQQAAKQLEGRLVKAGQLATNLQYFYRLESETGVKLTDVRQTQIGRAGSSLFIGVPYTVTFQGTFSQVLAFLERVESGKHLSKFSSVSFNKAAGVDTTNGLLSVNMNIDLLGTP